MFFDMWQMRTHMLQRCTALMGARMLVQVGRYDWLSHQATTCTIPQDALQASLCQPEASCKRMHMQMYHTYPHQFAQHNHITHVSLHNAWRLEYAATHVASPSATWSPTHSQVRMRAACLQCVPCNTACVSIITPDERLVAPPTNEQLRSHPRQGAFVAQRIPS